MNIRYECVTSNHVRLTRGRGRSLGELLVKWMSRECVKSINHRYRREPCYVNWIVSPFIKKIKNYIEVQFIKRNSIVSFKYIFNFLKKVKGIAMFKIGQSNENFVVKFYYEFQRSKGFLLFFFFWRKSNRYSYSDQNWSNFLIIE